MLNQNEISIVTQAVKLVERGKNGDAEAARLELQKLDAPGLHPAVGTVLRDASGLLQSYSLRTPEERKSQFFENSFKALKERAERAGEE